MSEQSEENHIDIWETDQLNRSADAMYIKNYLVGKIKARQNRGETASCVLNVDAGWGQGKTFFMERFAQQLRTDGYLVAEVNAWKDDYAEDPFIPVLAEIDGAVSPIVAKGTGTADKAIKAYNETMDHGKQVAIALGVGVAGQVLKKVFGLSFEEVKNMAVEAPDGIPSELTDAVVEGAQSAVNKRIEKLTNAYSDGLLKQFNKVQQSISSFKRNLALLLSSGLQEGIIEGPLFVLIDELDRCRPPHAIAMLERIKHLFEINNVVFVLATNTSQLEHSISAVYGEKFNAKLYLRRFFDRTYDLDSSDIGPIINQWIVRMDKSLKVFSVPEGASVASVLNGTIAGTELDIRTIEQCLAILEDIADSWETDEMIELPLMLPLIIGFHSGIGASGSRTMIEKLEPILKGASGFHVGNECHSVVSVLSNLLDVKLRHEQTPPPGGIVPPMKVYTMRVRERESASKHQGNLFSQYPDIIARAGRTALVG